MWVPFAVTGVVIFKEALVAAYPRVARWKQGWNWTRAEEEEAIQPKRLCQVVIPPRYALKAIASRAVTEHVWPCELARFTDLKSCISVFLEAWLIEKQKRPQNLGHFQGKFCLLILSICSDSDQRISRLLKRVSPFYKTFAIEQNAGLSGQSYQDDEDVATLGNRNFEMYGLGWPHLPYSVFASSSLHL